MEVITCEETARCDALGCPPLPSLSIVFVMQGFPPEEGRRSLGEIMIFAGTHVGMVA